MALAQERSHHVLLDLPHELHVRLLELLVPGHAEHRVLASELAQRPHERGHVCAGLGNHLVGEHGRKHRTLPRRLRAKGAPWHHVGEPGNGAYPPGRHLRHGLKARPLVEAHLVCLLLPRNSPVAARKLHLGTQRAARHLHPREALAARPARDPVHARRKLLRPVPLGKQLAHAVEQVAHAFASQRRPKEDREDVASGHQAHKRARGERPALQKLLHGCLVARGCLLRGGSVPGKQGASVKAGRGKPRGELGEKPLSPEVLKVALAHEDEGRDAVALEQVPQGLGVALNAVVRAHHENRGVERGDRALRLGGEVHVTGCVHEHEMRSRPVERRGGREDRDAALALHGVGVEVGASVVHAPGRADGPCLGEHGLRKRGLACVHMRQKPHDRLSQATPLSFTKLPPAFIIA